MKIVDILGEHTSGSYLNIKTVFPGKMAYWLDYSTDNKERNLQNLKYI